MKITTTITGLGSTQPDTHSSYFYEGWELVLMTPVCTNEQSMEANEDDMQCNVRQIALHSVSHYPGQPQSMTHWIPIYSTWGETPMEHICISETHVARLPSDSRHPHTHAHTHKHTHSRPPSDCKMKLQEVQYRHVTTSTMRATCMKIPNIHLATVSATVRGGKYLQYSPKVTGKSGADGGEWIWKSDWMRYRRGEKKRETLLENPQGRCNNGSTLLPTGFPLQPYSLHTVQIQNDTEQYITGHKCVFGLRSAQLNVEGIINRLWIQLRV